MKEQTANPLATEPIGKLLLQFSVPTALTLMVNYLYNIVDQIFIGQKTGIVGIAATNVAFPLTTLCMAITLMIADGCAANISLHLGRKEQEQADSAFGTACAMLVLFDILLLIFGNIFLPQLMYAFGATETVFSAALEYSRIILIGLPFMICNVFFTAIIRADGNPKYTMKCMMAGAVINVVLDPIFIFLLDMGITGAAIATVIGQVVSGLLCIRYIPKLQNIALYREKFRLCAQQCKEVVRLGIPSFFTQICAALMQIVMNNMMRKYGAATVYGSDIALSCYGMVMKIYQLAHSMLVGVSSGTQPINGYNFGAKQYDRVRKTYRLAVTVAFLISLFWFLFYQIFAGSIGAVFVKDSPLYVEFTKHFLRIYMIAFFVYGPPMSTSSFFQAIGKPSKALLLSLSRQAFFLVPLALILSSIYGLDGALAAAPIADLLTFILAVVLIATERQSWKKAGMIS